MKTTKVTGSNIAGGNPKMGRVEGDFYATNPRDTLNFLKVLEKDGIKIGGSSMLEPCAGAGHITEAVEKYHPDMRVDSYDINPRASYIKPLNYLDCYPDEDMYDLTLTNPPFKHAREMIDKSLEVSKKYVMMFLKIQFLEGVARKEWFDTVPLKYVYVYSYRATPWRNGQSTNKDGKKWANTMAFGWFIFEKGYQGEPIIRWI